MNTQNPYSYSDRSRGSGKNQMRLDSQQVIDQLIPDTSFSSLSYNSTLTPQQINSLRDNLMQNIPCISDVGQNTPDEQASMGHDRVRAVQGIGRSSHEVDRPEDGSATIHPMPLLDLRCVEEQGGTRPVVSRPYRFPTDHQTLGAQVLLDASATERRADINLSHAAKEAELKCILEKIDRKLNSIQMQSRCHELSVILSRLGLEESPHGPYPIGLSPELAALSQALVTAADQSDVADGLDAALRSGRPYDEGGYGLYVLPCELARAQQDYSDACESWEYLTDGIPLKGDVFYVTKHEIPCEGGIIIPRTHLLEAVDELRYLRTAFRLSKRSPSL